MGQFKELYNKIEDLKETIKSSDAIMINGIEFTKEEMNFIIRNNKSSVGNGCFCEDVLQESLNFKDLE